MALPASGNITLLDLVAEFGGSPTHELTEYYRGGAYVPDVPANSGVPTSGLIGLTSFYGAVNRQLVTITISANQTNYVLNTAKVAGYTAGIMDVTLVINSGVYISGSSTGGYALDVDTSWAGGDTISIVNNGFIVGMGGAGGAGSGWAAGSAGGPGGPAFRAQRPVNLTNNGTIGGGGGGGGGGQGRYTSTVEKGVTSYYWTGGGGGGGGRSSIVANSGAGAAGGSANATYTRAAAAGAIGTSSAGGAGGLGAVSSAPLAATAGTGGTGSSWGVSGAAGGAGSGLISAGGPYMGGGAGVAVSGNANINWVLFGTRLGPIV